ncbi:hypothetical protein [Slackia heliotrinireducens]|jgi:hypothetical protein|uniref:hypothetical protein n=1 Tax=Slackia heliotrinireducens TaxID=84110 RepID=UPI0033160B08
MSTKVPAVKLLAAFALVVAAVCSCAAWFVPAFADEVENVALTDENGSDGMGASGSVVQTDSEDAEAPLSGDASDETEDEASEATEETGVSAEGDVKEEAIEGDAAEKAEQEAETEAATRLDVEGNSINDGQLADTSFLYDASISDLNSADSYYDNQKVQVQGEVVGDPIHPVVVGEGYVWITLREPETGDSVVVYMSEDNLALIDTYGAHGKTGTTLLVLGTYHLDCAEHSGESDLHAISVSVVEPGSEHPEEYKPGMFVYPLSVVGLGAALALLCWWLKERAS